jgi:F-box-like
MFDNCLYDELILYIFSYLSWVDLCVSQPTNRNWARLTADNELWRNLYMRAYGRTRLRGSKGFISRADGREVKPLPGRAKTDQLKDWKWMFRISSNWRKGKFSLFIKSALRQLSLVLGRCLAQMFTPGLPLHPNHDYKLENQSHIILAGSLTITSSSLPSQNPTIIITFPPDKQQGLTLESSQQGAAAITALALDQSPPTSGRMSLAGFLSTGEFSVFEFNHTAPLDPLNKFSYRPTGPYSRTASPIIKAVYHHPLLVTLSRSFSLCLYDLSSGLIRLTQTLNSFTSYPPASLVLSTSSPTTYKLVLAYAVPVYPGHWSVGATEFIISKSLTSLTQSLISSPAFYEEFNRSLSPSMGVITTRTIRAVDVPLGWVDENKLRAMREQWSRKVSRVADAQSDGKWLVLAPGDGIQEYGYSSAASSSSGSESPPSDVSSSNSIPSSLLSPTGLQLYRLVLPAQSNSISASPPKLNFVRTLYGQTSPVTALALADGRCVSLGLNGSIWVWDLEGGTGAEVAPPNDAIATDDFSFQSTKDTVSFDERQIITAYAGKIVVRRFDI